ncbi:MAG TPA: hypothetical protein VL974_04445 [Magnetospirillum sp.]|jgi:hypothetical protein|nr:hypothetical protein [Magnetospirillum sp.]
MNLGGGGGKSLLARLRDGLRRQEAPAPLGTLMSRTDAVAERLSAAAMEELFAARAGCQAVAAAFARFVGEPGGRQAIRKALHIALEDRMRAVALTADPPERNGFGPIPAISLGWPLDGAAARALGLSPPPRRIGFHLLAVAGVLTQAVLLAVEAVAALAAPGRPPAARQHFSVAIPNFTHPHYWQAILDAVRERLGNRPDLLLLINDQGRSGDAGPGTVGVDPKRLPVRRGPWLRDVVLPSLRLLAAVLGRIAVAPFDGAVLEAARGAFFEARQTLPTRRLLDNFAIRHYVDHTEYTATHVARASILHQSGGLMVRWPHCVMDNPGAALSYLGYDLFLSGGAVEKRDHGATWSASLRPVVSGLIKNDRRLNEGQRVAPDIEARIAAHRAAGGRVAAYFGMSPVPGFEVCVRDTLEAMADALAGRPEWLLVVKAKGPRSLHVLERVFPDCAGFRRMRDAGRVLVVPYDQPGFEPCAAGWLCGHMDFGVGFGSVQAEALVRGIPHFCYYPVMQDTPTQRLLAGCGLLHDDVATFRVALGRWLDAPEGFLLPIDVCREAYDRFADDQALDRVAELLWCEEGASGLARRQARP